MMTSRPKKPALAAADGSQPRASSLLLMRHGQSTWNAQGLWQGWADPPLTHSGQSDAEACAEALRAFGFERVHSSDLARAHQTATIVAAALALPTPTVDRRLRERSVGAWAGLDDQQIEDRWPGQLAKWRRRDYGAPAGGGEDAATVVDRLRACLLGLFSPSAPVLVVSHIGAIRALEGALGAPNPPMPNLGGRWLYLESATLHFGQRYEQHRPSGPSRPGRL